MNRFLHIVGVLVLVCAPGWCDQKAKNPSSAKPLRPKDENVASPKAGGPNPGGGPKAGLPKPGPRPTNPANPMVRLFGATPEERDRALEKLNPRAQEAARKQFAWFDSLPKEEQARVLRRAERFDALTPEQRDTFRRQTQAWQQMPQERKQQIGAVLRRLETLPEEQRQEWMRRPAFQNRFSPEEQKLISDLLTVM